MDANRSNLHGVNESNARAGRERRLRVIPAVLATLIVAALFARHTLTATRPRITEIPPTAVTLLSVPAPGPSAPVEIAPAFEPRKDNVAAGYIGGVIESITSE